MNKSHYIGLAITVVFVVLIIAFLALERDPYTDLEMFDECGISEPCVNICSTDQEIYDDKFLHENFPFDRFIEIDNETKFTRHPLECSSVEKRMIEDKDWDWEFSFDGAIIYEYIYIKHSKYCMDPTNKKFTLQICITDHSFLTILRYLLLFIAVSFMIVPVIIFASFPELKDTHGKMSMALLISQAYILALLPMVKLSDITMGDNSLAILLMLYFGEISTNFIMNAMCFDIYLTFKHFREPNYHSKYFKIICSILGLVLIAILLILMIEKYEIHEIFFFLIAIFIMTYFILFFMVLLNIFILIATLFHMVHLGNSSDTSGNTRLDVEKERYWTYVKIFAVLVIIWTIEMMTFSMHQSYESEVIADLIKVLCAALISYLLVWKPKVYNLLFAKYKSFNNEAEDVNNV